MDCRSQLLYTDRRAMLLAKADDMPYWPQVEVLPPLGKEDRPPGLSDGAISRIFELIARDTGHVASTYKFGDILRTAGWYLSGPRTQNMTDIPVIAELVQDRRPLYEWYHTFRWYKDQLVLNDWVYSKLGFLPGSNSLTRRNELQQKLDQHRMQLWPTIRRLLLTRCFKSRIKAAAQLQMLNITAGGASALRGGWILRSPVRAARFMVGGLKIVSYSLHWLVHEYGVKFVLLKEQRQRVRFDLIERAIFRGLEVQKKMEVIEAEAKNTRWARLPLLSPAPEGPVGVLDSIGAGVQLVAMDEESQKTSGTVARLLQMFAQFSKKGQSNANGK